MNRYLEKFFSLRCAPDILAVVGRVQNMEKELTEAIGVLRHIQRIVLKSNRQYRLLDFCAGNALVSVLAVHLFPNASATAIDKLSRKRNWELARRFSYVNRDIYQSLDDLEDRTIPTIVVACHACGQLSKRVIEFYQHHGDYLVLLPCCGGSVGGMPTLLRDKLDSYERWAYSLYQLASEYSAKCDLARDRYILSPKNIILTAKCT